jgi:hypothetical protein
VVILVGDSVVGRTLGQLLEGVGYEVRLLGEPEAFGLQGLLEGVNVLLLMPDLGKERCEDFLITIGNAPETARIPILALSAVGEETPPATEKLCVVAWPCELEELARRIEAARQPRWREELRRHGGQEPYLGRTLR